ncbi:MAG: hypothetical protein LUH82_00575 [Clostridiales bacterium]|nr:hypothetical protein [Clostridiales bacterium]
MKASLKAAACGLVTAASVVLMFLGGVLYIFSYAVPVVLGVLLYMFKKTFKTQCAAAVYVSTCVLSLLFVPEKECVLMYILFFGYYPLFKEKLDKIRPAFLKWLVKLAVFNISIFIIELLCVVIFNIEFFDGGVFSSSMLAIFAVCMNILFLTYEFLLKYYLILYEKKLEKKIKSIFR